MNFAYSRFPRALAFAFSVVLGVTCNVTAQDGWTFRSPSPTPNRIVSYAHGNGLFVGVGELGEIVTSPDGVTWTTRESGTEEFLKRVVFGANTFVTFSSQSILTSSDGIVWNRSARALFDVAFGNGVFVAFAPPSVPSDDAPCDVFTSTDALTWTRRASFTYIPRRMEFANGVFVAPNTTGGVITSTDGITWTGVTVASTTQATVSFAAGNNRFLLNYGNMTYVSSDGLAWREVTEQVPYQSYTVPVPHLGYQSSMGFAGGFFYIQQARHSADSYRQYRSSDGEHWVPVAAGNLDFSTLGSGGGMSVASEVSQFYASRNPNSFAIHSSADGLEWPTRTTIVSASGSLTKVVQGLGRFFYGGKFSNDGLTWAPTPIQPTHGAGDRVFTIATKDGVTTVQASSNGLASTPIDVKLATPRAVAFGGGIYVMVGGNGELSSSNNGDTWTVRSSTTAQTLHDVIYAFNRFIAAGDNGTLITSSNGTTWTAADPAPFANADLKLLAATSDRLLVHAVPKPTGTVASTTTLSGGIQVVISSTRPFASLAALNGVFLGVTLTPPADGNQYYIPLDIQLWESTDGVTWVDKLLRVPPTYENRAPGSSPTALAVGNGTALLSVAPGYGLPGALTYSALAQRNVVSAVVLPEITYPPVALTIHRGETATFAVGANGSGPLTYRWNKDGVALPGVTGPQLTVDLVTTGQAGNYTVTVTNAAGSVTSAAAALTVLPEVPLTITQQPASTEVANYLPATLTVAVTGSGPISYQWRRNGQAIPNATSSSYPMSAVPPFHLSSVGAYDVIVSAPHSQVTSTAATVTWGGLTTTISSKGQVRVPVGATVSVTAGATGAHPPFTYQWSEQSGPEIPGATNATLTLTNVQGPRTQSYAAVVRDSAGHHEYASFQLIVVPNGASQLTLATQPFSQPAVNGGSLTLSVTAPAGANYRYQWRRNFQPIEGATQPQLQLNNVSTATAGEYDVVVYNSDFTAAIVSQPATVTVIGGEALARLVNLSARAVAGTGENTMILGFVVRGSGSGDLLVRSIGPGLSGLGVTGFLSDPHLRVMNSSNTPVAENNDWSTATSGAGSLATSAEMSQLGAFQLTPGSRDSAALVRSPPNGLYSSVVSSGDNSTGVLLSEIYAGSSVTQRLVNLSARARVSTGDNLLIGGFVISGNRPMTVLLRGVGPSLAGKGIAVPLTNPKLTLFNSTGAAVGNNDNWGQAVHLDDLRAATLATGAFALNEGSTDAALLTTLSPGVYSVHVTSVDGSAGVALVEIYEVP